MLKLSQKTIAFLAGRGDPAAIIHLGQNEFLKRGGYVTKYGLNSVAIAKAESRINSIGLPKKKMTVKILHLVDVK